MATAVLASENPISFKKPTEFSTLTIKCQDGELYGDAHLVSRVSPVLKSKMTRHPSVEGARLLDLPEERTAVVESFLRVLDYFVKHFGLYGPSWEAIGHGDVHLPLTKEERIPFVNFCLCYGVPEYIEYFLEKPNGVAEISALIDMIKKHKDDVEDAKDKISGLKYSLFHEFCCETEKVDLPTCHFIWKRITSESFDGASEEWKRENALSSQKRFIEKFQQMGYQRTELGESGNFVMPEIKQLLSLP